jgi:hypothetical protein
VKVGDYDIEVTSTRIDGGWQSTASLPNGQKVISAPKSNQHDADRDVFDQAKARLYPQRAFDINRPTESMNIEEKEKWLKGAVNPKHKGYCTPMSKSTCTPRRKALARRFKRGDLHQESRKYPGLSERDEAVIMHRADKLLEDVGGVYEIDPATGSHVDRPECPYCGGEGEAVDQGRYRCINCGSPFSADLTKYDTRLLGRVPAKAAFYPSDGGSAGGGGGVTSV